MLIIQRAYGLSKLRGGDFCGNHETSHTISENVWLLEAQHYVMSFIYVLVSRK